MRTLRVVGLHEDGKSIVCEDPAQRERFLLPADERLRAAARGDITRLGQIEIELESQMRPREIQARIRAGESVEQVATSAGVPTQRVERFAYPVLLERSRIADLAQQAHPVHEDGPDVQALGEVVAYSFGARGQDYSQAEWDAWRGDDNRWVIGLRWKAGRSDNRAHWSFSPGAHGGTVTALDELAESLLDPHSHHAPRPVGSPRSAGNEQQELPVSGQIAADAEPNSGSEPGIADNADLTTNTEFTENRGATVIEAPIPEPNEDDTRELPRIPAEDTPAAERRDTADHAAPAKSKGKKKNHPAVPAWEDVLLGVRSQRG